MFNLGVCFEKRDWVKQDKNQAVEWYKRAADLGDIDAQEALKRNQLDSETSAKQSKTESTTSKEGTL